MSVAVCLLKKSHDFPPSCPGFFFFESKKKQAKHLDDVEYYVIITRRRRIIVFYRCVDRESGQTQQVLIYSLLALFEAQQIF